jgi:hypothetical protein
MPLYRPPSIFKQFNLHPLTPLLSPSPTCLSLPPPLPHSTSLLRQWLSHPLLAPLLFPLPSPATAARSGGRVRRGGGVTRSSMAGEALAVGRGNRRRRAGTLLDSSRARGGWRAAGHRWATSLPCHPSLPARGRRVAVWQGAGAIGRGGAWCGGSGIAARRRVGAAAAERSMGATALRGERGYGVAAR